MTQAYIDKSSNSNELSSPVVMATLPGASLLQLPTWTRENSRDAKTTELIKTSSEGLVNLSFTANNCS